MRTLIPAEAPPRSTKKALTNGKSHHAEARLTERELLGALRALRRGEFNVRLPDHYTGLEGQLAAAVNDIAQMAEQLGRDANDVFRGVANEGRTKLRLKRAGLTGGWRDYADGANAASAQSSTMRRNQLAPRPRIAIPQLPPERSLPRSVLPIRTS